jgi:ribosomal protein S12 methylthiotransferase accessory factor
VQSTTVQDAAVEVPDFPRLHPGISCFVDEENLVIRSVRGAFNIEPQHREVMLRIITKLDGAHDLVTLLGHEPVADAFFGLRMLGWFAEAGMILSGPAAATSSPVLRDSPTQRLDRAVMVSGRGRLANAVARAMRGAGVAVHRGGIGEAARLHAALLVCLDAPDLEHLDDINREAMFASIDWLPIFPFGDAVMVGSLMAAGREPCFRCFELRWLGISSSIALERAYLAYLRRGGWRAEPQVATEEADRLAEVVTSLAFEWLAKPGTRIEAAMVRRESLAVARGPLEAHPLCGACGSSRFRARKQATYQELDWLESAIPLSQLGANIGALAEGPCALVSILPSPRSRASQDSGLPMVSVGRFAVPEPDQVDGKQTNWCHGSSVTAQDARILAIVEAAERYAGLCPTPIGANATYARLAAQAILPTQLTLYSEAQYREPGFPFLPFDPEREMAWSWGYNLTRNKPVLVPATAVSYGSDDELLGETSSGVAAHSSRGGALLNAALELIERDAFMIHWLQMLSPPLIEPKSIPDEEKQAQLHEVEASGYTVRIADLSTDLEIPVYLALGFREDRRAPALIVGAGASLDAGTALSRALKELYAATLSPSPHWRLRPPLRLQDVQCLEDHARAYEHPDWLPYAAFLWSSPRRIDIRRAPKSIGECETGGAHGLAQLIEQLAMHGHDLIGVELTPKEIERRGLKVVRAIIPGLQPLGFGDRIRLGGERLHEAPARMGYRTAPTREDDLNRIPHCFP